MGVKSSPGPCEAGGFPPVAAGGSKTSGNERLLEVHLESQGRSLRYPTYYRVGRKGREDVYWHPVTKYAIERDHNNLVELRDTAGVSFFPEMADLIAIWDAVEDSLGRLREAMDAELLHLVDAYGDKRALVDESILYSDCAKGICHEAYTEVW